MNVPSPLTQTTAQVWGARQDVVKPKSPSFLAGKAEILLGMSDTAIATSGTLADISGTWTGTSGTYMVVVAEGNVVDRETVLKESVLTLIRRDKSIPADLRLKKGTIKELDDGVFVKRRLDGVLEIYVSEE
jgi:hypothetical protein